MDGQAIRAKSGLPDVVRRAFAEFLAVPTTIILGFLLLALASFALDRSGLAWLAPLHSALKTNVFSDAKATSDLLGTIAGSLITVTSITISLMLVALQQPAGSLTSEVFDQFLRRRINQIYFRVFVGLALFALVTLATVRADFNPVFGGTFALGFSVLALYLLILLLYTSINQMRPAEIIEAIHHHTLAARSRQLQFIRQTWRSPRGGGLAPVPVRTASHGYVTGVDLKAIAAAATGIGGEVEVVLRVSVGSFVAFGDLIAEVRAQTLDGAEQMAPVVHSAVQLELQRDLALDPAHGIEQIETIAGTSISTAKSNPAPGLIGIRCLRDLLARWAEGDAEDARDPTAPVVYADNVFDELMDAFEALAVVSSESMQHQCFAEVLRTCAVTFDRLPVERRRRMEDLVLRILSALGDHVLTAELDGALADLTRVLTAAGRGETAAAVTVAHDRFRASIGRLHSRATRVSAPG